MVTRETPLEERRKSYCPECARSRGNPTTVSYGPHVRIISYKCPACGQEWLVYSPSHDAGSEPEST